MTVLPRGHIITSVMPVPTSIPSPVIMLPGSGADPKVGAKAAALSRLAAAGFPVPPAFVVSADCYRAHLWASGVRAMTVRPAEAEEREQIRAAIASSAIPEDVRQAILNAYADLCERLATPNARVAVRASAVEGGTELADFPGAYETYLNVSGADALELAIRRVWASLWSGKAAAYRFRRGVTAEPAMAVVVQRMLTAERVGAAATVNPVTGDPRKALVSCGQVTAEAEPVHHELDLASTAGVVSSSPEDSGLVSLVAEKAVLVEEALGGPLEIEWAVENGALWFLQVRAITDVPPFFPVQVIPAADAAREWRRVSTRPTSALSRSLLRGLAENRSRRPARWRSRAIPVNGYVYVTLAPEPSGTRRGERRAVAREIADGLRALARWEGRVAPDLLARARESAALEASSLDHERLMKALGEAVDVARTAMDWLLDTSYPCQRFGSLLRDLLSDVPGMGDVEATHSTLTAAIDSRRFMRDARIHDLAIRFAAADARGQLHDGDWWPRFREEAAALARDYGYVYRRPSELYDIWAWSGWLEDKDAVLRKVSEMLPRDDAPSLVTLRAAAESEARKKTEQVASILGWRQRRRFRSLLRLARAFAAVQEDAELIYALACSSIRLAVTEVAGRLVNLGVLLEHDDVFHLELDELVLISAKPSSADCARIARAVANRKHELWLEGRLTAPDVLRPDS